ncbi:hypothetical protein M405DRAFT_506468 [Rhizopogon salebrosus TDB-379]|nr:hypothetical protein M405DRAFT_506468 [Rhizopogon salebrosus TDB-379]
MCSATQPIPLIFSSMIVDERVRSSTDLFRKSAGSVLFLLDDGGCLGRYPSSPIEVQRALGEEWDRYTKRVRYQLLPGVYYNISPEPTRWNVSIFCDHFLQRHMKHSRNRSLFIGRDAEGGRSLL